MVYLRAIKVFSSVRLCENLNVFLTALLHVFTALPTARQYLPIFFVTSNHTLNTVWIRIADLCRNVQCEYGARCEAGECVCPTNCDGSGDEAVCASNMVTFPNECELQKTICSQPSTAPKLTVIFYGDCKERYPVAGALSEFLINGFS